MVYDIHQGIVLRTYIPQKQKLSVLDAELGRIDCIPQNKKIADRLFHGAYISYALKPWGMHYLTYDISLIEQPPYLTEKDFLFFHHVLELCFYFLPAHNQERSVFELVKSAYIHPESLRAELSQKIFLCHFFRYLGIYPRNMHSYSASFFRLISGPFNSKVDAEDEEKVRIDLQRWLLSCVSTHPYAQRIKTMDFLKVNHD